MRTFNRQEISVACACITLLTLASLDLSAQTIYRSKDAKGNPVFSDQPPAGGQADKVQLSPMNRFEAPEPRPETHPPSATEAREEEPAKLEYRLSIRSPTDDTTIPMGPGNFTITADVAPALLDNHKVQLLFNGTPMQQPQVQLSWSLQNVPRGEHDFAVTVVDGAGKELARSQSVRINVLRPSLLYPNRQ